jgi:hypothetical protein
MFTILYPGDEVAAPGYKTTRYRMEKYQGLLFNCPARCITEDVAAEMGHQRGSRGWRIGRLGLRLAFRRIARSLSRYLKE